MLIKDNLLKTSARVHRGNTIPQFDRERFRVKCFWFIQTTIKTTKNSTIERNFFNHNRGLWYEWINDRENVWHYVQAGRQRFDGSSLTIKVHTIKMTHNSYY